MVEESCHVELLGGATWIVFKHCLHINKFTTLNNVLNRHRMCWHPQGSPCLILSLDYSQEVAKRASERKQVEKARCWPPPPLFAFWISFYFSWKFIKMSYQNEYFCEVWLLWHSHNTLMFIYDFFWVVCFPFFAIFQMKSWY